MNQTVHALLPACGSVDCPAAALASRGAAGLFTLAVLALEAWLRVPVRPVLDAGLETARARFAELAAVLFPPLSQ